MSLHSELSSKLQDRQESWEPSPVFFRYALATLLMGCLGYIVAIALVMPEQTSRFFGPAIGAVIATLAWYLLLKGRAHDSIKLVAVGTWLLVTFVCTLQGGVRTPAIIAYPVCIMFIGWLFSARAAALASGLTVLVIAGFVVGETYDWLPRPAPTPAAFYALIQIMLTILSAFLVNFLIRSYKNRLDELRQLGRELNQRTQELETSKADLAITIEATRMVFWEYDLVKDYLIYDDTMLDWLQLDATAAPHSLTHWLTLLHPQDREPFMASFMQASQVVHSVMDLDYRLKASGGDWVWVHTRGKVIRRAADGSPLLAGGGTVNISERKNAEESLKRSETLLRSMLESSDEGILMVANDGRVLSFNQRFLELWNIPESLAKLGQDNLLLAHVLDQLIDPDAFLSQIKRLYGSVDEAKDTLLFKNGRVLSRYTQALVIEGALGRIWCFRDITETTRFAADLAASRSLLQLVIDTAPMRVFWKDLDLRYMGCNPAFARDAGFAQPDELIGKLDVDLPWKEQADLYNADDRLVMSSGVAKHSFDEPQTTPDGHTIWLRTSKVPLRNHNHETIGILGIYEDITPYKMVEFALLKNNALLQGILDNIPVGLSAFDSQLRLVAHNRLFRKTLDLPDTLFSTPVTTFEQIIRFNAERGEYGSGDRADQVERIIERARNPVPHLFERTRPNGSVIEVRGTPMPEGGFVTTYADVSERKRAEAEIRNSEQLLRTAIETIDEAFVLYGPDDRLVLCNDKYRSLYATSSDLIVTGASFEDIIRQGALRGQYKEAQGRIDEWVAERMAIHRAGNIRLSQVLDDGRVLRIFESKMPDGSTVGFRVDITDMMHAKAAAEEANRAKSRFLATMSHEIRTPMNGILGMAQLLLMPNLQDSERRDYARTILSSGQTLLTLLNDILDLSKIESGKFQLDAIVFEPNALIRETQTLFAGAIKTKNLQLDYQWHGHVAQRYKADAHRLRQMLSNLLGNAIKFTTQGRIRIDGIEVERSNGMALLEFAVTDTGIGIEHDKLDLLFKPFSQADSSTTRVFGGSGLGLSIVKNLAHAMGGTVGVASEPGTGSRFWFQINAIIVAAEQNSRLSERETSSANTAAPNLQGHILVAEDNPVNAMVIGSLLGKLGLTHSVVTDGQQAVDAIVQGCQADLILMDLHMPVMDGYNATQSIRQWELDSKRPRLPIIALTADAFEEDHQHCLAVGMDDFLTKPIALQALVPTLSTWLTQNLPNRGAPAHSASGLAPLDAQQFLQLVSEITPLLRHNKFSALSKLKELQKIVVGTHIEADVAQANELLESFRFDLTLERLQRVTAELSR